MSAQERWLPRRGEERHGLAENGADCDYEVRDSDDAEVPTSARAHAKRKRHERATRKELEEPWRP